MGLREKSKAKKRLEVATTAPVSSSERYQQAKHYHDQDVELDAIERLRSNIIMLDDLQQRLQFMNNELESILGSKLK